jgi:hypothetical protein
MSIQTLKKRIAVVAVSTLTAGVLSVLSAPAASATYDAGELVVSSATATTPGLCAKVTTASSQSVVAVAGSSFTLTYTDGSATDNIYLALSGNVTISSAGPTWEALTQTTATNTSAVSGASVTVRAGSVGTGKISIAASSTTSVIEAISVSVVASCANLVYSPTYSYVAAIGESDANDTNAEDSNSDTTGATLVAADSHGYIGIKLADAYNGTLDTAAMVATVTTGDAFVTIADETGSLPTTGKAKTSVVSSDGSKVVVKVSQAVAGKPTVATVQVTYGGTLVGSRTFTFEGYAASIVISDVIVGKVGANAAGNGVYFRYLVKDSAGNNLRNRSISNDSTANAPSTVADISSGFVDGDTDATDSTDGSKSADITSTNMAAGTVANIICTKDGKTSVGVQYVDPLDVTTTIKASVPVVCADPLDTWTISMDKATYAPGEIATLTLTGKDENGQPAPTLATIGTVEYSFGGMTAVTAPTSADLFNSGAGIKTYKFSVGTTEGAFVGTFKIAGDTDTAAKTVQYKVANPTATVSNADVLKSIVSLIASINKQIQALQKLILQRR